MKNGSKNGQIINTVDLQKEARRFVNKFRDNRDVTPFSKLSYDESFVVSKYYLIHELIKIGKPAIEPVLELTNDKNYLVREVAIKTLGEIGDRSIVPIIVKGLSDEKRRVRASALSSLKRLTGLSFGSYAKRNKSHENQNQVIKKWLNWWNENHEPFMVEVQTAAEA